MEEKEAIEIWNKLGIASASVEYEIDRNCHLGEISKYSFDFFDEDENSIDKSDDFSDIIEYFTDKIEQFHFDGENSGGWSRYDGRDGTITITLLNDNTFEYDVSDYHVVADKDYELANDSIEINITEEEFNFLQEYVVDISGGGWRREEINYKKDFVMTKELEEIIYELQEKFVDKMERFIKYANPMDYIYDHIDEDDEDELEITESSMSYTTIDFFQRHNDFYVELEFQFEIEYPKYRDFS